MRVTSISGSTIVAVYAAIVATLALLWQLFTWHRQQVSRLSVDLSMDFVVDQLGQKVWNVQCDLINRGAHPIRIKWLEFKAEGLRGGILHIVSPEDANSFPIVEPHDGTTIEIPIRRFVAVDVELDYPVFGTVRSTTGATFRSSPTALLEIRRIMEMLEERGPISARSLRDLGKKLGPEVAIPPSLRRVVDRLVATGELVRRRDPLTGEAYFAERGKVPTFPPTTHSISHPDKP